MPRAANTDVGILFCQDFEVDVVIVGGSVEKILSRKEVGNEDIMCSSLVELLRFVAGLDDADEVCFRVDFLDMLHQRFVVPNVGHRRADGADRFEVDLVENVGVGDIAEEIGHLLPSQGSDDIRIRVYDEVAHTGLLPQRFLYLLAELVAPDEQEFKVVFEGLLREGIMWL